MNGFISYKFTGEKKEDVDLLISPIKKVLEELGHNIYCNFYDEGLQSGTDNHNNFVARDYVYYAFEKINDQDFVLVLLTSEEKSEGMLLEVGYAIAKNVPVIVAVKEGVTKTYLPTIGTSSFVWKDKEDLLQKLKEVNFN